MQENLPGEDHSYELISLNMHDNGWNKILETENYVCLVKND